MKMIKSLQALDKSEEDARRRYVSDARFFHACFQGFSSLIQSNIEYQKVYSHFSNDLTALDSAISKFELTEPITVYAGHGNCLAALGSIHPEIVKDYVGFRYRYNGFISTSSELDVAEHFIERNQTDGQRHVLLEFQLTPGFNLLNMTYEANAGEMEFLLGRNHDFEIIDAVEIDVPRVTKRVLRLSLKPL